MKNIMTKKTLMIVLIVFIITFIVSYCISINLTKKSTDIPPYTNYTKEIGVEIKDIEILTYWAGSQAKSKTLFTVYNSDYDISNLFSFNGVFPKFQTGDQLIAVLQTTARTDNNLIIKRKLIELKGVED